MKSWFCVKFICNICLSGRHSKSKLCKKYEVTPWVELPRTFYIKMKKTIDNIREYRYSTDRRI